MLFPLFHQMTIKKNPSRLASLWLGCTAPIFNLPITFWKFVMRPIIVGTGGFIVWNVMFFVMGLFGYASTKNVSPPTVEFVVRPGSPLEENHF